SYPGSSEAASGLQAPPATWLMARLLRCGRKRLEPARELLELPFSRQGARLAPAWRLVGKAGDFRLAVHGGERSEEPQPRGVTGKTACPERLLQRAIGAQDPRCSRRPQSGDPRQPVGWIAAQRDELRNPRGIDAVELASLRRPDPRDLAGANRIKNGRAGRGKLERISVAAGDQRAAAAPFFGGDRRGEEIIGLVARGLRIGKAARGDELRQHLELLEQCVVEFAAALIGGKLLVPISGRVQRVPANEHGPRLLRPVESQQHVGEAKDRAGRPAAASQNRFRQGMIAAMGKRVAVDDQQWPARWRRRLRPRRTRRGLCRAAGISPYLRLLAQHDPSGC